MSNWKHSRISIAVMVVQALLCVSCRAPLKKQVLQKATANSSSIVVENDHTVWSNGHAAEIAESGYGQSFELVNRHRPHLSTELLESFTDISIQEVIQIAFANGDVLRSLGGAVVAQPESAATRLDPALRWSDPNYGIDSALANFDTQMRSSLTYQKNDDVFNNRFLGAGATEVVEGNTRGTLNLQKNVGNGAEFGIGANTEQQISNSSNLLFPRSWTTVWEAKVRQPLLRGRGVRINQIAGPNYQPGFRVTTGILLARVNAEISQVSFERSVRGTLKELLANYWQLRSAYSNYQILTSDRESLTELNKYYASRSKNNLSGGELHRVLALSDLLIENRMRLTMALHGDATTGRPGIYQADASLRRLMGIPNDNTLLRPVDVPIVASVTLDWDGLVADACTLRPELREQRMKINRARMELEAAKNYSLPQLDAVAIYRNNGFGNDLFGGTGRFSNAFDDASSNDHGEYEFGLAYDQFLGTRRARNATRHYELSLRRESAIQSEIEDQIVFQLSNRVRELESVRNTLNRQAERFQLASMALGSKETAFKADLVTLDEVGEQHRKLAELKLDQVRYETEHQNLLDEILFESGRILGEYRICFSP